MKLLILFALCRGFVATCAGQMTVEKVLMDLADALTVEAYNGTSTLHEIIADDNFELITELLLHQGINIRTVKNFVQKQPEAVQKGFARIIELLDPSVSKYENARTACKRYSKIPLPFFVIGGIPAKPGDFPWMAALGYPNRKSRITFECGGTLISEEFVLTAAHCIRKQPILVRLGRIYLTDRDARNYGVKEIIKHPSYSRKTNKNDIALIRLDKPVVFASESIRPACLEVDLHDIDSNLKLNVSGWGALTAESNIGTDWLHKTQLTTVPLAKCNATYLQYNKEANHAAFKNGISESQYCAQDWITGEDSCHGDSGGPLQIFHSALIAHVVGIVSFGIGCGQLPGIYTRVAYYVDWIESHVWPNSR